MMSKLRRCETYLHVEVYFAAVSWQSQVKIQRWPGQEDVKHTSLWSGAVKMKRRAKASCAVPLFRFHMFCTALLSSAYAIAACKSGCLVT